MPVGRDRERREERLLRLVRIIAEIPTERLGDTDEVLKAALEECCTGPVANG